MKICRIISSKNEIIYGLPNPSGSDEVRVLKGSLRGVAFDGAKRKNQKHFSACRPAVIFALGLNYGNMPRKRAQKTPHIPVVS